MKEVQHLHLTFTSGTKLLEKSKERKSERERAKRERESKAREREREREREIFTLYTAVFDLSWRVDTMLTL